ncbi:MAG TPA: hypothetical protein DEV93_14710 [Chloroflexi bacterium]|nr:hypothetical protein [Chloroflexota bacterium]
MSLYVLFTATEPLLLSRSLRPPRVHRGDLDMNGTRWRNQRLWFLSAALSEALRALQFLVLDPYRVGDGRRAHQLVPCGLIS